MKENHIALALHFMSGSQKSKSTLNILTNASRRVTILHKTKSRGFLAEFFAVVLRFLMTIKVSQSISVVAKSQKEND